MKKSTGTQAVSEHFQYIPRKSVKQFTNGLYSPRYMANLDCRGLGPRGRVSIGGQVCYPLDSFNQWLQERTRVL